MPTNIDLKNCNTNSPEIRSTNDNNKSNKNKKIQINNKKKWNEQINWIECIKMEIKTCNKSE